MVKGKNWTASLTIMPFFFFLRKTSQRAHDDQALLKLTAACEMLMGFLANKIGQDPSLVITLLELFSPVSIQSDALKIYERLV